MATKLYEEDINKYVDWGGDESTNGLPVSGEKIQKFIKDSLNNKFGFMYYDKDATGYDSTTNTTVANHTATNQYIVFADAEDFKLWAVNPSEGNRLILARFDAPAPATIEVSDLTGSVTKTILLSDKDKQAISFNYVVKDKSNTPQAGESSISISITNNTFGTRVLPTIGMNLPKNAEEGIKYEVNNIGEYLTEGINTISITITSKMYNVSTTITYQYRVLNLTLSSTFNNGNAITLDNENTGFNFDITANGVGNKFLRVFIDGTQVDVLDNRYNERTRDLFIGANNPVQYNVNVPFADRYGDQYSWVTEGKHSLQLYFFVQNGTEEIRSQLLYYDIVVTNNNRVNGSVGSFILFKKVFDNKTEVLPQNTRFSIDAEQYVNFDVDYTVLNTAGRGNNENGSAVIVYVELYDKSNTIDPEYVLPTEISSGSTTKFEYTPQDFGEKELHIVASENANMFGDDVTIDVNIKESDAKVDKVTNGLVLELSALNRSNTEANKEVWESTINNETCVAQFNKVLWNTQNGWLNNCLVLNNGATVTVPMNIFSKKSIQGLTFEIDFETENVQDDNAVIMQYGNEDGAGIFINACSAALQSNNKMRINTNYKDGARQKIQFIFGYNGTDSEAASGYECPYLMYIVVNGILDRVTQFTSNDGCSGNTEDYTKFVIGNTDGRVTTKIHNIRIYSRALLLDECVNNFIMDSNDVRTKYLKNDIYSENNTIDVTKVLNNQIPVMTIFGDITDSIVQVFNKKANVPIDVLYQDPLYPEFNFFARDAWMSNQGTSSMNYPRRNLRLYFNKEGDGNTLKGHASKNRYDYKTRIWWGLTDSNTISRIQSGDIENLDAPIELNGITYKPLTNKKTLKKNPQTIDKDTAIWFIHSGIKIYSDSSCEKSVQIKNLNKYTTENPNGPIYVQGAYARFKTKDLYTDRWTLKCDYAESSMTHNAGIGRLWGEAMRNVDLGNEGFTYDIEGNKIITPKAGSTNAQRAADEYEERTGNQFGDIRTSCDGYPIIIINRPRIKNGNQFTEEYGQPVFLGLYNIMTDKGSTPLFGFEDLKDEFGNTIFDAGNDDQRTECWECLQNGSHLAQMSTVVSDDVDGSTVPYTPGTANNEDRLIFKTYEARWPDNDDLNDTRTDKLESLIRFVNFCKDAVSVRVGKNGEKDGYELSDYTQIDDLTAQEWFEDKSILNSLPNKTLYLSVPGMSPKDKTSNFYAKDSDGNVIYDDNTGKPVLMDQEEAKANLYKKGNLIIYYRQTYASQVTAISTGSMEPLYSENETNQDLMIQRIYEILNSGTPFVYVVEESDDPNEISYEAMDWYPNATDEIRQWYYLDQSYDRTAITKTVNTSTLKDEVYTGKVYTYDGKRMTAENEQLYPNAWVTVYLTKNGSNYTYVNELGEPTLYASGEEVVEMTGSGNILSKGSSFKGHTLFEYFQDQKYEHFDIWKLACYYVYLMRFGAVDQVIKNTMMTTEDGKHYYFINYDNDTTLGVRNDGYLAYDWQIDRETYDKSVGSYAYAGFGSVLWNLLEQDQDFLDKVQKAATAMATSNVLTYDIAIDMFNVKQSGTWGERLYNNSELYKYIDIFKDTDNLNTRNYNPYQNTKYLPFVHGSRASHRDWWLKHRFDLYDSKWSAGEYATNRLDFYMGLEASPSNEQSFLRIVAGSKFYYTIMSNNRVLGNNFVELEAGQEYTFKTKDTLILGNPMQMYGVYKAKILDFSVNRQGLGQKLSCNWNEKSSLIEELILGGDVPTSQKPGCAVTEISNINKLNALKVLDIRTCSLMTNIDLLNLGNLRKFLATGSSITNFIPAKGVILEEVSLPNTVKDIRLNNVTIDNFTFKPSVNLKNVEIYNVDGEALGGNNLFNFIVDWYSELKKAGAKISEYSCKLSFKTIELEPTYVINGEEVKSLDLLNTIKKDFGLNANGEENFEIIKGIIKLYGDNENGGLTQENYDQLVNAEYNEFKKLWNYPSVFDPLKPFHFDSENSVFVTVTSDKELVFDNGDYNIIAGQKVKITTTIFPNKPDRIINVLPGSINPINNVLTSWGKDPATGNFRYAFGQAPNYSYLSNDNGNAILDIYEYTDTSNKSVTVKIFDSLISDTESIYELRFNIENAVKPTGEDIIFLNENNIQIYGVQEINEVKDYNYIVDFEETVIENINIDIESVEASFNSNVVVTNNKYGDLSVNYNEEIGKYVVTYVPNMQNTDENIPIYTIIKLADRQHSSISSSIIVKLKSQKITGIKLGGLEDDEEVTTIENYVKDASEITTVSGKKVVSYHYPINIVPGNYNVPVKSMEIITDTNVFRQFNIVSNKSNNIIESIDIVLPVSNKSILETGEFTIKVTDIYNNVIEKTYNVKLGYFIPEGIKLFKTITAENNVVTYDASENSNKTTLLMLDLPNIKYQLFVYSIVNGIEYVWANGTDISKFNLNNVEVLNTNEHVNATYSELNSNTFRDSTIENSVDLISYCKGNGFNFEAGNIFKFELLDATTEHRVFVAATNIYFNVTFNGITVTLDKDIIVERTAALVTNFAYQSEKLTKDEVYFLDKNLNIYDLSGFTSQIDGMSNEVVKNTFVSLIYIYEDNNSVVKYVSLDPWKLNERTGYKWWDDQGSWCAHDLGKHFGNQLAYNRIVYGMTNTTNIDNSYFANYSDGYIFQKAYDYYRIICAGKNNPADGGYFTIKQVGTDPIPSNLLDLCIAYYEGKVEFTRNSIITDEDMIFYYINDYINRGMSNFVCKPLSSDDYVKVMENYGKFAICLNKLDYYIGQNEGYLAKQLFDTTKYGSNNETFDSFIGVEDYTSFEHSKVFWYFDKITNITGTGINKENIQIAYNLNGTEPDEFVYEKHDTWDTNSKRIVPKRLVPCLFGPYHV